MSRIGKQAIQLPDNVSVSITDALIMCKGPKGFLERRYPSDALSVSVDNRLVTVKRRGEATQIKALHGLWRSLIANMVHGVSQGFEKTLELKGVGYRATVDASTLTIWLGYSHPVTYASPENISISVDKNTIIKIHGIDKELVGEVAASIRRFRPVEPYKGRGIRYVGERVLRKAGKSAKTVS